MRECNSAVKWTFLFEVRFELLQSQREVLSCIPVVPIVSVLSRKDIPDP